MRHTLTGLGNYVRPRPISPVCPHLAACPNRPVCPACRDGRWGNKGVARSGPATADIHWKTGMPGARIPQSLSIPVGFNPPRGGMQRCSAASNSGSPSGCPQLLARWRLASMSWIMGEAASRLERSVSYMSNNSRISRQAEPGRLPPRINSGGSLSCGCPTVCPSRVGVMSLVLVIADGAGVMSNSWASAVGPLLATGVSGSWCALLMSWRSWHSGKGRVS